MPKFECTCEQCKGACTYNPGWFLPGEAEIAAKHMGLTIKEFFDQYLGINWWEGDDPIFVLAPALVGETTGSEYPGDPEGTCVFFNRDGLCDIHPVKPYECAKLICNDKCVSERHEKVAMAWKLHQNQIKTLLGREPETEEYYGGGLLGGLFGW